MDIKFNGALEPSAIRKAVQLLGRSPIWMVVLRVTLAVLVLFVLGNTVFSLLTGADVSSGRLIRSVISSLLIGYFVAQPYLASRRLYKALASRGSQPVTGTATALGISYDVGAGRSMDYAWNDYYHVFKTDDLIVLTTSDVRVSIMPRSLFATEQDWKYFCQYVESRVKPVK